MTPLYDHQAPPIASAERGVEVYGHYACPRVKWTCRPCGKRNDDKLMLPVSAVERKWCKFCKKMSSLMFSKKKEGE